MNLSMRISSLHLGLDYERTPISILVKISIIIPVYNVEQYLEKCLNSVLVDNQFAGQVICVNDGSTDGSLAILEEYAKRAESGEWRVESFLVIDQPNAGLSAARNTGLNYATGDYVFFLDSDDWVLPGALERILSRIDGEDVVYFNAKKYYEEQNEYEGDYALEELNHISGQTYFAAVYDKPRNLPYVCVWGGFYKRSFLLENNLYNEPGIYHEDTYFTPQVLLKAQRVSSVNEYLYVYRVRKGSIVGAIYKKHIRDVHFIVNSLYHMYMTERPLPCFGEDLANNYIDLMREAYTNNLSLSFVWTWKDSWQFLKSTADPHKKHVARLSFISPRLAYMYQTDRIPMLLRRLINRYL